MKFTVSQIEFLMTKMEITDVSIFEEEARVFVPTKRVRVKKPVSDGEDAPVSRVRKPVAIEDQCNKLKKDGNPCLNKAKSDGLCGRHCPKVSGPSTPPLSAETVSDSDVPHE